MSQLRRWTHGASRNCSVVATAAARDGDRNLNDQSQRRRAGAAGGPANGDGARKNCRARTVRGTVPAAVAPLHAGDVAGADGGGGCGGAGFRHGDVAIVASDFRRRTCENIMKVESNLNSGRTEPLLRVTGLSQQFVQRRTLSRSKFT